MKLRTLLLRMARRGYDLILPFTRPVTPSVRILLVREGMTLLIHHSYASKWYFPGGGVKRDESLVGAAMREAREEVGAVVRGEPRLLGIYLSNYLRRSDHIVVYVSEDFDLGAAPPDTWEIEGCAWFSLHNLPPDMQRACRARVQEYLAGGGPYSGNW
ncbi:MAG: NUDIX domain-containing protein [Anaerolineales bacterium]|nr:NUDIX domain-containing protein [Anaerolineales bacterium]